MSKEQKMIEEQLARLHSVLREIQNLQAGEPVEMVVHYIPAPDVKAIRARMGMNQLDFSRAFGISVGTLRNWEQGRRCPQGPAYALLQVMDKEPEAVKRALAAAREEFKRHKVVRLSRDAQAPAEAPAKATKPGRRRPEGSRPVPQAQAEVQP